MTRIGDLENRLPGKSAGRCPDGLIYVNPEGVNGPARSGPTALHVRGNLCPMAMDDGRNRER